MRDWDGFKEILRTTSAGYTNGTIIIEIFVLDFSNNIPSEFIYWEKNNNKFLIVNLNDFFFLIIPILKV